MIVLTAVGQDRPGIASRVARVLFETGCNIEDATMTILSGEFAIILMLAAPPGTGPAQLDARFDTVRRELGLHVALREIAELPPEAGGSVTGREGAHIISVIGADHPGIVCRVTELLAAEGANITDLNSKVLRTAATPVYMLVLEVVPPPGCDMASVTRKLRELASDIAVEIRVNPVETADL